jgi:hypothetical protein
MGNSLTLASRHTDQYRPFLEKINGPEPCLRDHSLHPFVFTKPDLRQVYLTTRLFRNRRHMRAAHGRDYGARRLSHSSELREAPMGKPAKKEFDPKAFLARVGMGKRS